jgi:hypothetical protein
MGLLDVAGSLLSPPDAAPKLTIKGQAGLTIAWTEKTTGETKLVRFDAVSQETHEALMTITKHPVEQGADVVDHAREEPRRIMIEGYVSNKPLLSNLFIGNLAFGGEAPALDVGSVQLDVAEFRPKLLPTPGSITRTITAGIDAALKPKTDKATVQHATGTFPDRAKNMWDTLRKIQVARQLVQIWTALEGLQDMLIERVSAPRSVQDGNGTTFQVELVEIRIVASETVDAPEPAEKRGAPLAAQGSKNAKESTKPVDPDMSLALKGAQGLGLFTGPP